MPERSAGKKTNVSLSGKNEILPLHSSLISILVQASNLARAVRCLYLVSCCVPNRTSARKRGDILWFS